ncbi:M-phase inducer phosphatase isoform X1 [Microplitis demolitor]|uniref:M-phase inducer phosphatase isoform X1 n=2 Tax=Microplitis demolitor TaxID=69319 RepID=UPI0006D51A82|nr:M-phase inducer phosphatase isoform X1 [Microplitis demolitor]
MLWETVTDSCDVCHCTRLFKNVFKIKGTPDGAMKSRYKSRRSISMASKTKRISSPELSYLSNTNKENTSALCSPLSIMTSPLKKLKLHKSRCPLEDCDPNSQDSGYGAPTDSENFRFAEPSGVAPRRMSTDLRSPNQSPLRSSPQRRIPSTNLLKKLSTDPSESMDDGFNELVDVDSFMENNSIPNDLTNLISGAIYSSEKPMECDATTPEARTRPLGVRRSLSLQTSSPDVEATPPLSKVRSCLFRSPTANSSTSKLKYDDNKPRSSPLFSETDSPLTSQAKSRSFKRPEPPTDSSPILVKRTKKTSSSLQDLPEHNQVNFDRKTALQRSYSEPEAHAHIKSAIHRSTTDSDLTGDFSKTCILPLAEGHHEDLKSITAETLSRLIRGEFSDTVSSYKIVDCRYPYEYEAGHIEGALNLFTKDLIEEYLMTPITEVPEIEPDTNKRRIIVFHCEFSWERGPNLSRYLRNIDRKLNKEHYPALHYPEIYLLHGGYQQFYRTQMDLCVPQGYRPMTHPDHEEDLRRFRSKSKSWQGEKLRNGLTARANIKRLGL